MSKQVEIVELETQMVCSFCAETNTSNTQHVPREEGAPWNKSTLLIPLCEKH